MNEKMKTALKRVLVLIFSVVLLLGSVSYYVPSYVQADDWSADPGGGTAVFLNPEGSDGKEGHARPDFCRSMDCVMISFWENTADGKKVCVGCVIQPFNTSSSYYSNTEFARGVGGLRLLRNTGSIVTSLGSIIKPECSVPASIPIYVTGDCAFGFHSVNSGQNFNKPTIPGTDGPRVGVFPYGLDASSKFIRSTPADRFALTKEQFAEQLKMQGVLSSFNNAAHTQYVLGTNVSIGVSEIALNVRDNDIVLGCCFPENYNVMGVEESGIGDIFIGGKQACFTYLGSTTTTTSSICTYDVVGTPDHPDYSEKPNGNPDKSGEYVINKVYIDLVGTDDYDFTTPSVCPAIVIDDERGKIDSAWSFVGWKPSAIGASGYSKNDHLNMYCYTQAKKSLVHTRDSF